MKPNKWESLKLHEKITYYMSTLDKSYAKYVDKIMAKDIAKQICGNKIHTARIIRILSNYKDIKKSDIHINYLIKASHGSGYNIDPFNMSIKHIKRKLKKYNAPYNPNTEKQYKHVAPRFFVEEKIEDWNNGEFGKATTYLLTCFHGVPKVFTIFDKFIDKCDEYFIQDDGNLNFINTQFKGIVTPVYVLPNILIIKDMIDISKKLSKLFEFVRIDLYLSKSGKIYFSEFTFSPNCGNPDYPNHLEIYLGSLWL